MTKIKGLVHLDTKKEYTISADTLVEVTYAELVKLRNNSQLTIGCKYRITDYECTTITERTRSAGNRFDIIVTALSENTLDENARAIQHEGDTYFAGNDLNAWELKYSLDNDLAKCNWVSGVYKIDINQNYGTGLEFSDILTINNKTYYLYSGSNSYVSTTSDLKVGDKIFMFDFDTNSVTDNTATIIKTYGGQGKGVIYWLKDEFNNECPYDFKNIQYQGNLINNDGTFDIILDEWYYTFSLYLAKYQYFQWGTTYNVSRNSNLDTTINGTQYYGYTCSSIPSAWSEQYFLSTDGELTESSPMFTTSGSMISYGGNLIINSTYGSFDGSLSNENAIHSNIISFCGASSNFGRADIYPYQLNGIVFLGKTCHSNIIGCHSQRNTFGEKCFSNICDDYFKDNIINASCNDNKFGTNCSHNKFGYFCYQNNFGEQCYENTINDYCYNNTLKNDCRNNIFGSNCAYNYFDDMCSSNKLGDGSSKNIFEKECANNIFGQEFSYNKLINSRVNSDVDNGEGYGIKYNTLVSCYGSRLGNYVQNIVIHNVENARINAPIFQQKKYPVYVSFASDMTELIAYWHNIDGTMTYYKSLGLGNGTWLEL